MTKVSRNAAWEFCLYIKGLTDYGIYQFANNSVTTNPTPLGMGVEIENGPEKMIKITVAKSLISNPQVVRFVVTTEKPNFRNPGKRNHGSSSIDIFPGQGEFPGRVPGFVQVFTPDDDTTSAMQVIDPITYYFYDGINPITEVDDYGAVTANYVYAGGLHVARVTSDTFWYHCDALGSPRRMTDRSGSQVWNCFYYPFGEQKWPENEQISNSHQFTGKEYDTDMSLNYFCQRYYDPTIGRFMTLDPIAGYLEEPQTQNRYAYCINNPLKYVDPLGLNISPAGFYSGHGSEGTPIILDEMVVTPSSASGGSGRDPTDTPITDLIPDVRRGEGGGGDDIPGEGIKNSHRSANGPPPAGRPEAFAQGETNERRFTSGGPEAQSDRNYWQHFVTAQTQMFGILSDYQQFMRTNYPLHGSTWPPFGLDWWRWTLGDKMENWACAPWTDFLYEDLQGRFDEWALVRVNIGVHVCILGFSQYAVPPVIYLDPYIFANTTYPGGPLLRPGLLRRGKRR